MKRISINTKFLLLLAPIGIILLGIIYQQGVFQSERKEENSNQEKVIVLKEDTLQTVNEQAQIKYSNTELLDFSFVYPDNWKLAETKFESPDALDSVKSRYTNDLCSSNCKVVRLSKENAILDLVFQEAYDANALFCTNSYEENLIREDLYRIDGENDIYYALDGISQNITINEPQEDLYGFGNKTDEWSVIKGETYGICVGYGNFLENSKPSISILLENPMLHGTYDKDIIDEADEIIKSIQGLQSKI